MRNTSGGGRRGRQTGGPFRASAARPDLTALTRDWRRWAGVVALYARRGPARRRIDPEDYAALHHRLLTLCHTLAELTEGPERARYQRMGDLVRPWLSLQALERTERELLESLDRDCRQAASGLAGRSAPPAPLIALAFAAVGASVLIGLVALGAAWGLHPADALNRGRALADQAWSAVAGSGHWQRAAALTTLAIAVSIYLVSRVKGK